MLELGLATVGPFSLRDGEMLASSGGLGPAQGDAVHLLTPADAKLGGVHLENERPPKT